jgi:hypothetical protein
MNKLLIATNVLIATVGIANADSIHRQVSSGSAVRVWTYRNYDRTYCTDMPGTVKVVTKPAHGTISQHSALSRIRSARVGNTHCIGQVNTGLEITYRSNPGFRGTDTFTLEVDWAGNNLHLTDTFILDVR